MKLEKRLPNHVFINIDQSVFQVSLTNTMLWVCIIYFRDKYKRELLDRERVCETEIHFEMYLTIIVTSPINVSIREVRFQCSHSVIHSS